MKVVCISDEVEGLTLGKVYFSQNHVKKAKNDSSFYYIENKYTNDIYKSLSEKL